MSVSYAGSGPYCFTNSLTMMPGAEAPSPAVVEVLTGSPFGMQLLGGRLPLFDVPPGTLGQAEAAGQAAATVEEGLDPEVRVVWQHFAVRVGARRLNDLASCLSSIGLSTAASVAGRQSRIVGGLQGPLMAGDDRSVAAALRGLAPTYEELRTVLAAGGD